MKKVIFIGLALMLAIALVLAGCKAPAPTPAPPTPPPAPTPTPTPTPTPPPEPETMPYPKFVTWATPTGSEYTLAANIIADMQKEIGVPGTVTSGHGSFTVLTLIMDKEIELGIIGGDVVMNALYGTGDFAKVGKQPVRYLRYGHDILLALMARASTPIESVKDLKDKKIMYTTTIPFQVALQDALLGSEGLTRDDIEPIVVASSTEPYQAFPEGRIDAMLWMSTIGHATTAEMAMKTDMKWIQLSEAEQKYVLEKCPWLTGTAPLPAGSFKGQDEAVQGFLQPLTLSCHRDLNDKFVYDFMKVNLDSAGPDTPGRYAQIRADYGGGWTLNGQLGWQGIPYHAAAVQYYKDRGVWTEEMDKKQKALLAELGETR